MSSSSQKDCENVILRVLACGAPCFPRKRPFAENGLFLFSVWGGAGPQTLGEGTHLPRD